MSKVLGSQVIVPLIKQKSYRKILTDFVDDLRMSKVFRNRQMYVMIANATYKTDKEIFKKHFAKAMGAEMLEEKVNVVKIAMAKLVAKVPRGYSKSADKLFDHLVKTCKTGEVLQYLGALE